MKIITTKEACDIAGVSRVTLWRLQREKDFPLAVRRGTASKGFIREEVEQWVSTRAQQREDRG